MALKFRRWLLYFAVLAGLLLYVLANLARPAFDTRLHAALGAACFALAVVAIFGQERRLSTRVRRAFRALELGEPSKPRKPGQHRPRLIRELHDGPVSTYWWKAPPGLSSQALNHRRLEIEELLNVSLQVSYEPEGGYLVTRFGSLVPPNEVPWEAFLARYHAPSDWSVPIGLGREGDEWLDFTETPHLLLSGITKSGKSALLRAIVTYLLLHHSTDELELVLIDMKSAELPLFRQMPHVRGIVACETVEARDVLKKTVAQLKERQKLIGSRGLNTIERFNAAYPSEALSRVFVIVDEGAELAEREAATGSQEKAQRHEIANFMNSIGRLGGGVGFHLVVAAQNPSVEALPSQMRSQVKENAVTFYVDDEETSAMTLGAGVGDASTITKRAGRCYFKQLGRRILCQAIWLEEGAAEILLRRNYPDATRQKPAVVPDPVEPEEREESVDA